MDNVNKIVYIDKCLGKLIDMDISDNEKDDILDSEDYINKLLYLLSKLSSKDLIIVILNCEYLFDFVDLTKFIKRYPINKTYLKDNKDMVIKEYNRLENFMGYINKISHDEREFRVYIDKFKICEVEEELLKLMPNKDLYNLSKNIENWEEKLFIFKYFKKESN